MVDDSEPKRRDYWKSQVRSGVTTPPGMRKYTRLLGIYCNWLLAYSGQSVVMDVA